jgi:AraC-like DNA-binding protein
MAWNRVLTINDPLLCRGALVGSDFEILPTAKGTFQADITQVGLSALRLARYQLSLPQVSSVTLDPRRKTFGFLTGPSSLRYYGTKISLGDIIIQKADVAHQVSESTLFGGAMSFPVDELNGTTQAVVGRDLSKALEQLVIRPDPTLLSRLMKLHQLVAQLARDSPEVLQLPEVCRALEERLLHLLVRCLADGASIEITAGDRRHTAVMARFEEFLEANPGRAIYLTEICAAIGVAERTLRAACEEHVGMGPIRFLTLRRMHFVRRALLDADPSEATVTDIVTGQGFWELGRFSVAYRALFGESPSKTLQRPAGQFVVDFDRPLSLAGTERHFVGSPSSTSRRSRGANLSPHSFERASVSQPQTPR